MYLASLPTVPSYLSKGPEILPAVDAPPQTSQNHRKYKDSRLGASWYVPRAMCKRPSLFGLIFHRCLRPTCLQLGPSLAPKIHHQNRSKIDAKMHCILGSVFLILVDFCSQLGPVGSQKTLFFFKKNKISFEKSPFEVNIDFWSHFGLNFASFWHPKSSKILPKIDSKRH